MGNWQRLPGFHSMPVSQHKRTTHIILEPLDFIARLAALVPKPRVNLTRFHGVFAPNSALRQQVTPARRGRQDNEPKTSAQRHAAMTWDQRLKRAFKIDIESCEQCGGATLIYRESRHSVRAYQHYLNARCWPKAGDRFVLKMPLGYRNLVAALPDTAAVRQSDFT